MDIVELTTETWPRLERLFKGHLVPVTPAGQDLGVRAHEPTAPAAADRLVRAWVAVAPRPTHPRLSTSKITRSDAGPDTWSVTCFFVHRTARRRGLAATLLDAEGECRGSGDLYHGTLAMFLAAGFDLVERRGTRRALVRRRTP